MRRVAGLVTAVWLAAGCSNSAPPPKPKVALVSVDASSTEDTDPQLFRLDVTLGNVGTVAAPLGTVEVVNAGLYKSPELRIALPEFTLAADADVSPLAKGETRVLTFTATDRNRRLCPATCDNPHRELLQVSADIISQSGEWIFTQDVAVTCPNAMPRVCALSLTDACQGTDVSGQPLRCLSAWSDVLADNRCALVESDTVTTCGGIELRTVRVGGVDYRYLYNHVIGNLVAVISSKDGCLGGPCGGPPKLDFCALPQTFYECGDGGAQ